MDWPPSGKRQVWRTFNRRCQLLPMIDSLVSRKNSHGGSPARILFIGESIDRLIKDDVCNWAAALGSPAHEIGFDTDQVTLRVGHPCSQAAWLFTHSAQSTAACGVPINNTRGKPTTVACADSYWGAQAPVVHGEAQNFSCNHCSGCMTNFATLGFMYVFGVAPVGPYHMGKQQGWPERVPEVRLAHAPPTLTLLAPRLRLHADRLLAALGSAQKHAEGSSNIIPYWWVMAAQLGPAGRVSKRILNNVVRRSSGPSRNLMRARAPTYWCLPPTSGTLPATRSTTRASWSPTTWRSMCWRSSRATSAPCSAPSMCGSCTFI